MKYRIVPTDRGFKVQRKRLLIWQDVELPFGPNATLPMYFVTREAAQEWIDRTLNWQD